MTVSYYLCWVDDVPGFPETLQGHMDILKNDYDVEFVVDVHTTTKDFDTIVRNFEEDVICFVDYNLKDGNGDGLDGHELIALIRKHNANCKIVFYSSNATQIELRNLVSGHENVICVPREDLSSVLTDIATGDF